MWVAMLAALTPLGARAGNYDVHIVTTTNEKNTDTVGIKTLLEQYLDIFRYRTREDIRDEYLDFLVDHTAEQAAGLLATKGYFNSRIRVVDDRTGKTVGTDAQISAQSAAAAVRDDARRIDETTENTPKGTVIVVQDKPSYTVYIDLDTQAKIHSAKIDMQGLIKQQDTERAGELEFDWSLQEDEPFAQDDWALAKTLLLRKIRSDAYYAARYTDTAAWVSVDKKKVDVNATLDSGPYFTLGEVQVSGLKRYREPVVTNVNTIEVGEAYNREKLLTYQKTLQDMPYFSNVTVDVDGDPNNAQLTPIKVNVVELPTSNIKTVFGYGTDAGYRANAQYDHYNVFKRGWIYDARYDWQQKETIGQTSLSTPQNKNHFQWNLLAKMDNDRTSTVRDNTYQVGLHYARKLDTTRISYNLDYYHSILDTYVSHAWVLGVDWSKFSVDSRAYPRRGYAIEASVSAANQVMGSSASFVRWYGRYRYFIPFFKKDSLMLRVEAGAVNTTSSIKNIPTDLLFKAGGSGSLRGYPYHSIGDPSTVDSDKVLPAQFLATTSAEYTHWFSDSWGWAVFYDGASATNDLAKRPTYHGIGAGGRWRSPVGPIQFDLAYGFPRRKLSPHVSIGVIF